MKLKTLKDLSIPAWCKDELRQEAIKWIKHADKIVYEDEILEAPLRKFWIDRFNLTKENLK